LNFESVFRILSENFQAHGIRFAVIGALAMHAAGYSRTTEDVDFLIDKDDFPKVKKIMFSLGYRLLHESEDASNFVGQLKELGQVDFLHAHRRYAKNMLRRAEECDILDGKFEVKVLKPEDIIGLKIQASTNDPKRLTRDLADIERLLQVNSQKLDMNIIREYFSLFEREPELDAILKRLENAE
jgi:predicted nucleotidyltransferase